MSFEFYFVSIAYEFIFTYHSSNSCIFRNLGIKPLRLQR